jgi:hypothetical protein
MADISELLGGTKLREGWDKPPSPQEKIREKNKKTFDALVGQCAVGGSLLYVRYASTDYQKNRYIPTNEGWETVDSLMVKSLEQNTDLLWERYKNNIIPDDVDI